MSIAKVLKITLFFPAAEFVRVSEKLHELRCVEVMPAAAAHPVSDDRFSTIRGENPTGIKSLRRFVDSARTVTHKDFEMAARELDRIGFAIETITKSVALLKGLSKEDAMSSKSGVDTIMTTSNSAENILYKEKYDYVFLCDETERLWRAYLESERSAANYRAEAERLKPWLNVPVELRKISDGEMVKIRAVRISQPKWDEFIYELTKETTAEGSSSSSSSCGKLCYAYKISGDGKEVACGLVYPAALEKKAEAVLKRFGAVVISYPDSPYTPKEMYSRYMDVLDAMRRRSLRRLAKLAAFSENDLPRLKILYDYFLKIKTIASSERLMSGTDSFRFFKGWILAVGVKHLEDFLKSNNIPYYMVTEKPSRGDDVPIVFENKKPIEPFEVVTDLYGKPNYYEPDPTPWLAPFFAAFFGICMADALYGLIISGAGIFGLLKIKSASARKFMKLVLYCGLSTTVFGVLAGGYFGNIIDRFGIFSPLVPIKNRLMVFDPLKSSIVFLGGCLALGLVQTLLGSGIKFFTDIKNSSWRDALIGDLPTIGIQVVFPLVVMNGVFGVKLLPMNALLAALVIFSVLLMINQWIVSEGIVLKLFQMFFSVYGAITSNALSDVLSYSRLFALGLSTSLLAMVLNEIAALGFSIPYVGYVLGTAVIILFHPFIMAIGSLGAYVHTSRLQYLEFFNKFFQGGGREMKPLAFERKYTGL